MLSIVIEIGLLLFKMIFVRVNNVYSINLGQMIQFYQFFFFYLT